MPMSIQTGTGGEAGLSYWVSDPRKHAVITLLVRRLAELHEPAGGLASIVLQDESRN